MRIHSPTVTAALVALLLPGLVMAAPIAGPCGLCGDGDTCHMQQAVEPSPEAHSCCDAQDEATPQAPALGSSSCECGRDAPPALTAETQADGPAAFALSETREEVGTAVQTGAAAVIASFNAAPPPAPPTYLIDCAFLT